LGAVDKSQIIKLLSEFRQILNGGRLKKWNYTRLFNRIHR
jgi:hypothetical protein